ncbi:hypothetical protein [Mycolicibacterium gadium]|uniref:Uncharacterized protein n=1 Tax=Mycolicibacterium gadium TaxID=1794 RepID=A0A7I7WV19_MYCGU|nr:hypothetical protein [Mycolicibacterium gadium]BBZ21496.1 hypothetical protein MGAD_58310 [Mycolicibacterium gadium]
MSKPEKARMRTTLGWSACFGFAVLGGAAAWAGFADGQQDWQPTDLRADGVQIGGQNNSPGAAGGNIGTPTNDGNYRGGDNNTVVTVGEELPIWLSPLFDTQRNSPGAATGENTQGGSGNVVINLGG